MSFDQTRVFWKDESGWKWINTTSFGLETYEGDLEEYIFAYLGFYLNEISENTSVIDQMLEEAKKYLGVSLCSEDS